MKYYMKWFTTIITIINPFVCFTAALLHAKSDPTTSTLFTVLGIASLDGLNRIEKPKRDDDYNSF